MKKVKNVEEPIKVNKNVFLVVEKAEQPTFLDYVKFGLGFYIGFNMVKAAKHVVTNIKKK